MADLSDCFFGDRSAGGDRASGEAAGRIIERGRMDLAALDSVCADLGMVYRRDARAVARGGVRRNGSRRGRPLAVAPNRWTNSLQPGHAHTRKGALEQANMVRSVAV